jgi:UTP--glucose-1-phosphate uridylyltransferase
VTSRPSSSDPVQQAVDVMRAAGVADVAVRTFAQQHRRLLAGDTGVLTEGDLDPVQALPDAEALTAPAAEAAQVLDQTVMVRLNGGLGTSMGMTGPKALLPVRDGQTFLDLTARQVLALRRQTGARLPLLLMHSFATREACLAALAAHPELAVEGLPLDFVQSKVPKLRADDLTPVRWPADPSLTWAPPGHGDLYPSLQAAGVLDRLLAAGFRYAFVANIDNLGAVLDQRILRWFADSGAPFAMEVTDRTAADRKGGHLARRRGDGLVLREIAQTPAADLAAFQDVQRHRYFNTNNLWLDLHQLADVLAERDGVLGLPLIVNRKTVDPTDPSSTPVVQLETAMGAAIGVLDGALAIRVPRQRFAPVKTTADLLLLRSDVYLLGEDGDVRPHPRRMADGLPTVQLCPDHHRLIADFEARFPAGAPSLVQASRLSVRGDVRFGADVVVRGEVEVVNDGPGQLVVPDGAELRGP